MTLKNMSLDELRRRNEASQARREQEKRDEQKVAKKR